MFLIDYDRRKCRLLGTSPIHWLGSSVLTTLVTNLSSKTKAQVRRER